MNRRGVHRKQTATPGTHATGQAPAREATPLPRNAHATEQLWQGDDGRQVGGDAARAAAGRRRRRPRGGGHGRSSAVFAPPAAAAQLTTAPALAPALPPRCSGLGECPDRGAPRPLEDLLVPSAREAARRTAEEQTGRRGAEARGPERPRHRGAQAPPAPARGRGAWRTPDGPRGPRGQSRLPALRPGPRLGTRGAGAAFFRRPPRGRAAARHAQVPGRQRGGFGVRVHPRRPAPQRREPPFPPQGERGTPRGGVTVRGGLRGRGREGRGPGAQEGPAPRPRPPYLVHRAAREVQRPEQQLELHGRREAVEAEADVVDDRGRQQRRDAGRRP